MKSYIIAVDFDGTIVEDAYPKIGKPMLFAFDSLKQLQSQGHRLVLWTYRHGKTLEEAVEFCRENGIEFYAVNSSFEDEKFDIGTQSRKIHADMFIDDFLVGAKWFRSSINELNFPLVNMEKQKKRKKEDFLEYDSFKNQRRN